MDRQRNITISAVLGGPLILLAAIAGTFAMQAPLYINVALDGEYLSQAAEKLSETRMESIITQIRTVSEIVRWIVAFSAAGMAVGAIGSFILRRWGLIAVRIGYGLALLAGLASVYGIVSYYGTFQGIQINGKEIVPQYEVDAQKFWLAVPIVIAMAFSAGLILFTFKRDVVALFTGEKVRKILVGDRFYENVRTHGADPQYRKSLLISIALHILPFVLMFLLGLLGWVKNYEPPFGSGSPRVMVTKIYKQKEKKKKKKFILNENSSIIWRVATLKDSEIIKEIDQETLETYAATDPNAKAGRLGAGGGKQGGWPDGTKRGKIRFIRLKYRGRGWDDGMDTLTNADRNFLREFHKLTGLKVADKGEYHDVRLLKKYDPGYAPPFVYITGTGNIHMGSTERKILRSYLLDGGMLWADAGSPQFHRAFASLMRRVFPEEPLRVIADDDAIFQQPYAFANGAPPLWHHGGRHAMGVKKNGRWVVFYHPGDMNDAWKKGRSGMSRSLAQQSVYLGVNIVWYSVTNYLQETRKYRK
ncbi:MAG: DUF4159 domain-containing protein [Phycisphaerae bacterium]